MIQRLSLKTLLFALWIKSIDSGPDHTEFVTSKSGTKVWHSQSRFGIHFLKYETTLIEKTAGGSQVEEYNMIKYIFSKLFPTVAIPKQHFCLFKWLGTEFQVIKDA